MARKKAEKKVAKVEKVKLGDLRSADYNPRKIDKNALEGLKASLSNFGDISGVVVNQRTGNIVTGHQRVRALKEEHGDGLVISRKGKEGRIDLPDGSHVRVRYVDWDETTEKAANVAANNPYIQGEWTVDLDKLISELQVEMPDLFADVRLDLLAPPPESQRFVASGSGTVVDDPQAEWEGMPEFVQENLEPYRTIIMYFLCEKDVKDFAKALGKEVTDKTRYIWWRQQPMMEVKVDES
jgi:hypothetical protein